MPCIADTEKIRFITFLDRDISEMLPYLNSVLKGCIYNRHGHTLTIRKEGRLITLHSHKIAAGKLLDENDAREIVEWLRCLINYCHENRDSIEPDFERGQKLTALDIYKLLPGNNCRKCGELTCLAFAVKLSGEGTDIMKCTEIFQADNMEKRNLLIGILKDAGYNVPDAFSN